MFEKGGGNTNCTREKPSLGGSITKRRGRLSWRILRQKVHIVIGETVEGKIGGSKRRLAYVKQIALDVASGKDE